MQIPSEMLDAHLRDNDRKVDATLEALYQIRQRRDKLVTTIGQNIDIFIEVEEFKEDGGRYGD